METRMFDLGDILSVTTGKLVSPRRIEGVSDILGYMTGERLFTHQLDRAREECEPWLLRWHPQLARVIGDDVNGDNWADWLAAEKEFFGESLPVYPIPQDDHEMSTAKTNAGNRTKG